MHVHHLQHVPFEGLGSIEPWLRAHGHRSSSTQLHAGETLPEPASVDWLIVMGGPMGVYDEAEYPWLAAEKAFIRACIAQGKRVLGICLGAQLIAEALGARVYRNAHREIGWFPIRRAQGAEVTALGAVFPDEAEVFHWHGDTFELPADAIPLAESAACRHQGFIYKERVLALQFHLETTPQGVKELIAHCGNELDGTRYVQSERELLAGAPRFEAINRLMAAVLETMASL